MRRPAGYANREGSSCFKAAFIGAMKKIIAILCATVMLATGFCISGCTEGEINDVWGTVGETDAESDDGVYGYPELIREYSAAYEKNFAKAKRELEKSENTKFEYAKTIYTLGTSFISLSELFCINDAEALVTEYLSLVGYKEIEYKETAEGANASAIKNDVKCVFLLVYDLETKAFTFTETKDGAVVEAFSGTITDEGVFKVYSNADLKVTYEVFIGSDESVKIAWTDKEIDRHFSFLSVSTRPVASEFANEGTGVYVFSEGEFSNAKAEK